MVDFPVGITVAVGNAKGVLLAATVSVGEGVMVTGVKLGSSQAVGVPVGVLVYSGAAFSVTAIVGLAVGVISLTILLLDRLEED